MLSHADHHDEPTPPVIDKQGRHWNGDMPPMERAIMRATMHYVADWPTFVPPLVAIVGVHESVAPACVDGIKSSVEHNGGTVEHLRYYGDGAGGHDREAAGSADLLIVEGAGVWRWAMAADGKDGEQAEADLVRLIEARYTAGKATILAEGPGAIGSPVQELLRRAVVWPVPAFADHRAGS